MNPDPNSHSEAHELRILRAAFDEDAGDRAELAEQVAGCDECLAYAMKVIDEVLALHALAKSRQAAAVPPRLRSVQRLDELLDDVMVLRSHRPQGPSGPSGADAGEKAEIDGTRSVPVGEG